MKKNVRDIPRSILDLATILAGKSIADTFHNSLDLARHAETWGFKRYWLAEHHNMESIASSATSVLIGYIAGGTKTLRVGSGGIMLPNHTPLIIAEQFGTLASLYPNRIDLGLGRAPGTDQFTAMALRGNRPGNGTDFPQNILELKTYFSAENRNSKVRAIPGEGIDIPIWILGSSTESARLAGLLGLPYAFASHFAPAQLYDAIELYKSSFRPSKDLAAPYIITCVNVIAADTNEEAHRIATSFFQFATGIIRGTRAPLPLPIDNINSYWNEMEKATVQQMMSCTFIGSPETIKVELQRFIDNTGADELMATSHIYDHAERLRSYEILSQLN
ncbi:MAG: LLM class flavin-dependent oxidoreductase [Flavitalea sp.]